jgi:hypothetical protein
MKPMIESTKFGSIVIEGQSYAHDVMICLDGTIKKRKKKLSKEVYGSSHTISPAEAEHIYENGAELLVLGAGQYGLVNLSQEASDFFVSRGCQVDICPTPEAIKVWNESERQTIGLFHVTC